MSICPHPCPGSPTGPPGHRLGAGLGLHRRLRSEATDWNSGFRRGAVQSCSESSAVEPGEGHMGNVGSIVKFGA